MSQLSTQSLKVHLWIVFVETCQPASSQTDRVTTSYQVISHQVITGEQDQKYCKTLPALSNAMTREVWRGSADQKQKSCRALAFHVTNSKYCKLKCYIE